MMERIASMNICGAWNHASDTAACFANRTGHVSVLGTAFAVSIIICLHIGIVRLLSLCLLVGLIRLLVGSKRRL